MTSDPQLAQNNLGPRASDIIASKGLRITSQRVAVLTVLLESKITQMPKKYTGGYGHQMRQYLWPQFTEILHL